MNKAQQAFDTAILSVTQQRGPHYGHPSDGFRRASALISVVSECKDPELRQALRMICVKVSRLIHSPDHLDSIIDIAGYARTMCMIIDRRNAQDLELESRLKAQVSADVMKEMLNGSDKGAT